MRARHESRALLTLLLLASAAAAGCGGDDDGGTTAPVPSAMQGSWIATSVLMGTQDLIAQGMHLSFHFSADGEYSFLVSGDLMGMCDGAANCDDWGDFAVSGSQITFDPVENPVVFAYSLSGNVMTLTGSIEGVAVTFTLERA
jgi:hypothetical protein